MYLHTETQRVVLKVITGQLLTDAETEIFAKFGRQLVELEVQRQTPPANQKKPPTRERFKPRLVEA